MKRVAIMSWYSYQNYGTALQASALSRAVSSLGYEVKHIAYDPIVVQQSNTNAKTSVMCRIWSRVKRDMGWTPIVCSEREESFEQYINDNIPLTSACDVNDLFSLNCEFDAFICGSDQVWSPRCFDSHYFLDFVRNSHKKIAYAPSFGCERIEDEEIKKQIGSLLGDFGYITVREESGSELVGELLDWKPDVVLDPTLLLQNKQWEEMAKQYDVGDEPYCLHYFLGSDSRNLRAAHRIAHRHGLRVLSIPVFRKQLEKRETLGSDVGPAEFISLIQNATLVCTDSFHGMVFSTIFNKDFIPFERFNPKSPSSQNTRVYSYLKMIGCSDILLSRNRLREWINYSNPSIDYCKVNMVLDEKRQRSLRCLSNALERAMAEGC